MPDTINKDPLDLNKERIREDDRRIPLVEEIFHNIVKSIKTISIYKHNKDRFIEFVEPAYRLLEKFLKQNDSLIIKVEPYSFKFLDAEVYKDTDQYSNISYRFFRDGVRRIIFKQGLTINEFLQFVLIVSGQSQVSKQAEDTVSQLWLSNLENIDFTVIEGGVSLADSDGREDETEKVEMETIVNYLEHRLASRSDEAIGFARLSAGDIGMELEAVDQIKGLTKKPELVSAGIKEEIQEIFLTQDDLFRINRIKKILFAILKSSVDDVEMQDIIENFILIIDYLLLLENIDQLSEFITEIEKESINLTLSDATRERIMQLRMRIRQELNTDIRIERIFQILKTKRLSSGEPLRVIIDQLDENSYIKLPQFIEQVEIQDNLNLILEILKKPRPHFETIWVNLINSKKISLVTMAMEVIKDINFDGKVDALIPLLDSQIPQISLKALEIVASSDSEKGEKEVIKYIDRHKDACREHIIRLLPMLSEDSQANIIIKLLLDENMKLEDSHRLVLYTKMADLLELPQVESFFDSILNEKASIFTKSKIDEKKRLLIKAISSSPSLTAYQYLLRHLNNPNISDGIKKEISFASEMIKRKLQGR